MEKTLFNQVGEVKGKISDKEDSFSFQFTPQNENLRRTRGALFALISIDSKDENKAEKAKAFYHAFQSSYYAKVSGSIISSLSDTIDQVNSDFVKKEAQSGTTISMVSAVFWGSILYLARVGDSGVFVARAGKLKKLEVNKVVSGVLEDQDSVCLASSKFIESVNEEELANYLAEEKFEKTLERIDEKIAETESATCIVIRLSVNKPEAQPEDLTVGEVTADGEVEFPNNEEVLTEKPEQEPIREEVKLEEESLESLPKLESAFSKVSRNFSPLLQKTRSSIEKFFNGIFKRISKPWRKVEAGEHVDHVAIKKQRIIQATALVVILLVLSVSFGIYSKGQNDRREKINQLIDSAESNLNQAKNLKNINPSQAKSLVQEAQNKASEAEKLGAEESKIDEIESSAASLIAEITRSYIARIISVFDFTTLNSEAKISRTTLFGDTILATDKAGNSLFKYDLNSNEGSKVEGNFSEPENITAFQAGFYLQTKDGVFKLSSSGDKPTSVASNANWGRIVGAAAYQSNLYLLDEGKNEVWRYAGTTAGLGAGRAYLSADKPTIANPTAIAIDTFVWIVTEKGEVFKFSTGKRQEFTLSNMQDDFGSVVDIFTNDTTKNIYLLDQGKGRVVVVSKDGVYQAQYNHQELHKASSLAVDESKKLVYFAANGKLYSFTVN